MVDLKKAADEKFAQAKFCYETMSKTNHRAMTWGWENNSTLMKMVVQRLRKNIKGLIVKMHTYDNFCWLEICW